VEVDKLRDSRDPEVQKFLGVADHADPIQAVARLVRSGQVPHLRLGRKVRFSLPALKQWAAERIASSVTASAEAQKYGGD
jgi:hypothetical protein